jgi:hypothetical protein
MLLFEQLQAVRKRCGEAARGPWDGEVDYLDPSCVPFKPGAPVPVIMGPYGDIAYLATAGGSEEEVAANRDFISNARQDLPVLLADWDRIQVGTKDGVATIIDLAMRLEDRCPRCRDLARRIVSTAMQLSAVVDGRAKDMVSP